MTPAQEQAHFRLLASLPTRTVIKIGADKESTTPIKKHSNAKQPVEVNGKIYPSGNEAARSLNVAKTTLRGMIQRGLVRRIEEPQLSGIPIFKRITSSAASKARLRSYERKESRK